MRQRLNRKHRIGPTRRGEQAAIGHKKVAYLAGLATSVCADQDDIQKLWALDRTFMPNMDAARRESLYAGWTDAVSRTRSR